jgi:1-acyl-sn-glycerol-3-phosphate acyltransferase
MGHLVGAMIRRSVRNNFRAVYWSKPSERLSGPLIYYANHHGWMDGYLMFHVVCALATPSLLWIEDFDSFPLFRSVGGLRFTQGQSLQRYTSVRQTIRKMVSDRASLVLFPEGVLHRPPDILPFTKAMTTVAKAVPQCRIVPVAITYQMSLHQRPEAWVNVAAPSPFQDLATARQRLQELLSEAGPANGSAYEILVDGKWDVNERWTLPRRRI